MSDGGKGSQRRPGKIPAGNWEAIFKKPPTLCDCEQGKCKAAKSERCRAVKRGK